MCAATENNNKKTVCVARGDCRRYRGLMIDTSRHFLPLNALKRQVDALSFNKMNVLHWHMTDAQVCWRPMNRCWHNSETRDSASTRIDITNV